MEPSLNGLIEGVYFGGLVFIQSWEDPKIDRQARIRPDAGAPGARFIYRSAGGEK